MKEARYFYVPDADQTDCLPADEAVHALRVLRLKEGDEMFLMDGRGTFLRAEVALATNKKCLYHVVEALPQQRAWRGRIHLAIAPTKDMGRMEWMAEKATEIGFDEITFLGCQFSERKTLRTDRIDKIVVAAMKQSRKAWKPVVNGMVPFQQFVESHTTGLRCLCHCYEEFAKSDFQATLADTNADDELIVLVGPEGDFSVQEVQQAMDAGFQGITLGKSRLRTETAGLFAVTLAHLSKR